MKFSRGEAVRNTYTGETGEVDSPHGYGKYLVRVGSWHTNAKGERFYQNTGFTVWEEADMEAVSDLQD